ncbi:MAG TPA: hypothetical protein VEZ11_13250 [Thermoanaerobaculia bacterium]|nr:hypothetical protein [Thermoanaerobaculia bacterium]
MTKTLLAEYDAGQNALKLLEPLPELKDHDQVRVVIETDPGEVDQSWLALRGALSIEAGDSLAEAVERLYGRKS